MTVDNLGDNIDSSTNIPNLMKIRFSEDCRFRLESGRRFGPIEIAYKTFGKLNKEKSNAVLIFPTLTATPQISSEEINGKKYSGWWENIVGEGKAIDTKKFFVICPDHFGGCYGSTGPSSINPDTGKEYGINFPGFFIKDMARVVLEFLKKIGIYKLHAIVGSSIGGLLALEIICHSKTLAKKVIIIGSSHKVSAQFLALNYIARQAIMLDPEWKNGEYYSVSFPKKGLSIARQIGHISYLNHKLLEDKFGRSILNEKTRRHVSLGLQYQIESYLNYQGEKFSKRFDANSYIYLSKAIDTFDLEKEYGSIENAMMDVSAEFTFITISSDQLFPNEDTEELHRRIMSCGIKSNYQKIESPKGHDGLFLEDEKIGPLIRKAL